MRAGPEAGRDLLRRELCRLRGVVSAEAYGMTGKFGMTEILIVLALAGSAVWAALTVIRRFRRGGGCCGERGENVKRLRVRDRNPAHYPYSLRLSVGGMVCGNCAVRVENALNALDGVYASVDLGSATAKVHLKSPPDEAVLREAVRRAGYVVTEIEPG